MHDVVLGAEAVTYQYPGFTLGPLDLAAAPGLVHGVIGPNGSGKTTLVNLLVGLLQPSRGAVSIFGERPVADGRRLYCSLGYSPDEDDLIPELSAEEYWDTCAVLHQRFGQTRDAQLAAAFDYASRLDFTPPRQQIASYSHGMRKKTQIIAALLHNPQLVILDEPTNGLDPIAAYRLGELIRTLAVAGTAFLVTCHDLAWAERFTDIVTILRSGAVVTCAPTKQVLRRSENETLLDGFMRTINKVGDPTRPDASAAGHAGAASPAVHL
jgi:ABC-2 type transport system ATP-binding protein